MRGKTIRKNENEKKGEVRVRERKMVKENDENEAGKEEEKI